MKVKTYIFISFVVMILLNSCRTIFPSAQVNFISGSEQTITVRAVGVGINEENAIQNAEQKVFDVLFFRGLPESTQKTPLIGSNEIDEKEKHKEYFNKFYDNKRYKTFIMSSILTSSTRKNKKGKVVSVDVKVNLSALRGDIESFGVIRKFGY